MTQTGMRYVIAKVRSVRYDKLKYKLQTNLLPHPCPRRVDFFLNVYL